MFTTFFQHLTWIWQQPQLVNLTYALPGLLLITIVSVVLLPIPVETLMLTSLTLAKHWHYSLATLLSVFVLGTYIGLHIGYAIGNGLEHLLEPWLLKKFRMSPEQWQMKISQFRRFRVLILLFGLFVPGFRHLVGILAGATRMSYRRFSAFALLGAIFWVGAFTIIGWMLGK